MMKLTFLFSVLLLLLAFAVGCKDQLPNQEDPSSIVLPDSNVSYSRDIERVFSARCLGCHAGTYEPNMIPPSYGSLVNYQPQLVIATQGQNSLLIQLLDGRTQPFMPPGSEKLTQNQINGIKRWIDEGAQNN